MAEGILDFSKELDVAVLDQVVMTFYTGSGTDVKYSSKGPTKRKANLSNLATTSTTTFNPISRS